MKIKILFLMLMLIATSMSLFSANYIVKFKSGKVSKSNMEEIQSQGFSLKPAFKFDLLLNSKKEKLLSDVQKKQMMELSDYYILDNVKNISELLNNDNIESIEPNYKYKIEQLSKPNDALIHKQWALDKTQVFKAWQYATGKGVIVGVIDTGIDFTHPDLINQIWINSEEDLNKNGTFEPWSYLEERNGVTGDLNGIDDDGNGFVDDVIGYDFVDQSIVNVGDSKDIDAVPTDEHSHGTSVSGVIVAQSNNKIGISGIAFDSKVLTCRAFDATGNGESDDIANSIVYAVLQGAKVLNFSFGEVYKSSIVYDAVRFAYTNGVTMVSSSGNNNWDLKHYPSDFEEVISVTACNSEGRRSANGNYGNRLDITAPGSGIFTTLPDSSYGEKGGTSFASPHVAAAACLLLEKYPDLTPVEVSGILQASATDAGEFAWDYEYASGILNFAKAMETNGRTNISVQFPQNEQFVEKELNVLPVIGTITTPLFKDYQVFIGVGERPKYWDALSSNINEQVLNDTIYSLDLSNLKDTSYTVRIKINLSNNSTLEKRFYLNIISTSTPLDFIGIKPIQVYKDNYKTLSIHSVTNFPSHFYVKYRPKASSEDYRILSEFQKFTNFHTVLIDEPPRTKTTYEAIAVAYLPNGIKKEKSFEFTIEPEFFPENNFRQKDYGFPMSHLLNATADFYGDNKPCVVVNDLSAGSWGNIKIYQFDDSVFASKDNLKKKWIPRGIGDSNGDGVPEIFATVFKESALFQPLSKGDSPFSNILFIDTMSLNFWAADLFDIDNDGKDEMIAFSDTSFQIVKYIDGKYKLLAKAVPGNHIGTYPGFAGGDFDNDGKNEICFGNRDGNIFIYEFDNNTLELVYSDSSTFSSSEQYMTACDINNDGIPEIIIGNFGSSYAFGFEGASDPLWSFRIFQAKGDNKYEVMETINIYGVRGGIEYSNGVSFGDVDNDNHPELIISAFPNLYIFKWDSQKNALKPLWNYPYTYSNSAIVYDFDKNGINEVGFCTFQGTRFYEYVNTDGPDIPTNFNAWSVDTNKIYFEWQAVENATEYEILNMIPSETGGYHGYTVTMTNSTTAIIDTFDNNTYYEFVVRAINKDLAVKESRVSNLAEVFTHIPVRPLAIEVEDNKTLLLSFSGNILISKTNPGFFSVVKNNIFVQHPHSCLLKGDKDLILSFVDELDSGDYSLIIESFRDKYNSPTISDTLSFSVLKTSDEEFIYLKNIQVINRTLLKLTFSEDVEINSATQANNYLIHPYGLISSVSQDVAKNEVFVNLSKDPPMLANGKTYSITAKNIAGVSGRNITNGAGNTLAFVFFADDGNDAYIYPNPVKYGATQEIYFAGLPSKAKVVIYDLDMTELKILEETDGNGGVEWSGLDNNGNKLTNGVYLFKVITINSDGSESDSDLKKFLILP